MSEVSLASKPVVGRGFRLQWEPAQNAHVLLYPEGMVKLDIPANTYLSAVHEGPLASIAEGFAALYDHAAIQGLEATDFKLDIGSSPGLPPGRHELFIALQPLRPPRFS